VKEAKVDVTLVSDSKGFNAVEVAMRARTIDVEIVKTLVETGKFDGIALGKAFGAVSYSTHDYSNQLLKEVRNYLLEKGANPFTAMSVDRNASFLKKLPV